MAGVVIDISTGKVIERIGSNKDRYSSSKEKSIMEILAPDGRKLFSIGRVTRKPGDREGRNSSAG